MKAMGLICLMATFSGCSTPQAVLPRVRLEFRPASFEQATGMTEMTVRGSDRKIYLSERVLLSNEDVASTQAAMTPHGAIVYIELTQLGTRKFALATEQNLMKPIAIVVDGKVVSAPIVREKITGSQAAISGGFTIEEARHIASGIRR